jgi:hypothetical protein
MVGATGALRVAPRCEPHTLLDICEYGEVTQIDEVRVSDPRFEVVSVEAEVIMVRALAAGEATLSVRVRGVNIHGTSYQEVISARLVAYEQEQVVISFVFLREECEGTLHIPTRTPYELLVASVDEALTVPYERRFVNLSSPALASRVRVEGSATVVAPVVAWPVERQQMLVAPIQIVAHEAGELEVSVEASRPFKRRFVAFEPERDEAASPYCVP